MHALDNLRSVREVPAGATDLAVEGVIPVRGRTFGFGGADS